MLARVFPRLSALDSLAASEQLENLAEDVSYQILDAQKLSKTLGNQRSEFNLRP